MGKGDIKSRRGKLFAGSFGVRRPKKSKDLFVTSKTSATVADKPKKETASEQKKTTPKKATPAAKPKKEISKKETAAE